MIKNLESVDLSDDVMSKKAKVVSCFGNIKKGSQIAELCGCSPAYVSKVWFEYIEFLDLSDE